jgi:hypothetical protein
MVALLVQIQHFTYIHPHVSTSDNERPEHQWMQGIDVFRADVG